MDCESHMKKKKREKTNKHEETYLHCRLLYTHYTDESKKKWCVAIAQ